VASVRGAPLQVPRLGGSHWPDTAYRRATLPERVLQFGTGKLLRAVCAASVDAANRQASFDGRIAIVQSTPHGCAATLTAQDGLFTLLERGLESGERVERMRLAGSISRAFLADADWPLATGLVARPELRVIVSNVTDAAMHLDESDLLWRGGDGAVPSSFPGKLTDLLYTRFQRLPEGPSLFVIPTEEVPANGQRLAALVGDVVGESKSRDAFREWISARVSFCSSLVDRATTGIADDEDRDSIGARLGYHDELVTVTEPTPLWVIEGEPVALREAFAIDGAPGVVFERDIRAQRERKLRLVDGALTAIAPLALLLSLETVREASEHPRLGSFIGRLLCDEIAPSLDMARDDAERSASAVMDRLRNPWLDQRWKVIAMSQIAKMRTRVAPSIVGYTAKRGAVPQCLALASAAFLRFEGLVPSAMVDPEFWECNLGEVPGFIDATGQWLKVIESQGVDYALRSTA
jgi:tagaturonate reductase